VRLADKQKLLETSTSARGWRLLVGFVDGEIDVQQMEKRIRGRVKSQMEKSQREYYLNEQMKAIQKELGELDEAPNELEELARKIAAAGMPKAVEAKARAELNKLKQMSPMSAEATVVRNYIDWLLGVPWKKRSKVRKDLKAAQEVLDADHYGLEKVKERILEYLAVQQRVKKMKGPILCLVGPPGVGKTSLGQSIAKATNRKFVRMSLGGVRDEAEIRGHRRTYIGSMPGRHRAEPQQGRQQEPAVHARRDRQDVAWTSAAIRPRRCSRCSTPSRTTPSTTTTSRSTSTCPR
jgi:ATP-dependent Lon protease